MVIILNLSISALICALSANAQSIDDVILNRINKAKPNFQKMLKEHKSFNDLQCIVYYNALGSRDIALALARSVLGKHYQNDRLSVLLAIIYANGYVTARSTADLSQPHEMDHMIESMIDHYSLMCTNAVADLVID